MDSKYEIEVYNETKKLAVELAKSTLIPASFKNPADAWYAILYGRELGLSPIYSLNNIAVINGKTTLSSDATLGICMQSPEFGGYSVTEETDIACTVIVRRNHANGTKQERKVSFTIDDAKQAGLLDGKSQMYRKYPKRMLRARAMAYALREVFADTLAGVETTEEIESDDRQDPGHKVETPEYSVVEDRSIDIAERQCRDSMKGLPSREAAKYEHLIAEAKQNGRDALEDLAVEIEKSKTKAAPKPDPVNEPQMPAEDHVLGVKQGIISVLESLAKTGNYVPNHIKNSIKRQLPGVAFPTEDWKEAIIKTNVPVDDLENAMKYWKDRLSDISKTKHAPSPEPKVSLAERAKAVAERVGTEESLGVLEEANKLAEGGDNNGYELIISTWGDQ